MIHFVGPIAATLIGFSICLTAIRRGETNLFFAGLGISGAALYISTIELITLVMAR